MSRTTIPVKKETRDLIREAKGHERNYDEFLQSLLKDE